MPDLLEPLRERLLKAGVRPAVVHRYVRELREHAEDHEEILRSDGMTAPQARRVARSRLGTLETLAYPVETDPFLRSWASRTPFATFVLAPLAAIALAIAALIVGLVATANQFDSLPDWFAAAARAAPVLVNLVLPVAIGWTLAVVALRQRSRSLPPLVGISASGLLAATLHLAISLPIDGHGGEVLVGLTAPSLGQWALTMGLVAGPFLALPSRLKRQFALSSGSA